MRRKLTGKGWPWFQLALYLWIQASVWWTFATSTHRSALGLGPTIALAVASFAILLIPVMRAGQGWPTGTLIVLVMGALSYLIELFANLYWNSGTRANWGAPLSHIDAVYIALGTLTTAGSGRLSPATDAVRRLVTLQLCVEVLLVPIVVGIVVYGVTERIRGRVARLATQGGEDEAQAKPSRPPRQRRPRKR